MQQITGAEAQLAALLGPERPGPLVAEHVLETGNGALLVDDPRAPRLLLAMSGGNRALPGEPDPAALRTAAPRLAGLIDADPAFEARASVPQRKHGDAPCVIPLRRCRNGITQGASPCLRCGQTSPRVL